MKEGILIGLAVGAYFLIGLSIAEPILRSDPHERFSVGGPDLLAGAIIALFWPLVIPAFAADALRSVYLICKRRSRRGRSVSARELERLWRRE